MKRALITGVMGQDGSYLAEFLLQRGYTVFGMVRREGFTSRNLDGILDKIKLVYGDMRSETSLDVAIRKSDPDEIYNLAAQSNVPTSWNKSAATLDVNTGGLARILRCVEQINSKIRVYQASSSEMYGNGTGACNEETPMWPVSPYGVSKYAAHQLGRVYRNKGLYVVCGILFNHESPRRGDEMVTQKIARVVASWAKGDLQPLTLGNTDARRDWGFAGDYVRAMWLMLQPEQPHDYVVGMGESHSVLDFVKAAVHAAGLDWSQMNHRVQVDERFQRANEIRNMVADASRIQKELGWAPEYSFEKLVFAMVAAQLKTLEREPALV